MFWIFANVKTRALLMSPWLTIKVIFMFLIIFFIGLFNNEPFGNMWDEVKFIYWLSNLIYSMWTFCTAFQSSLTPTYKTFEIKMSRTRISQTLLLIFLPFRTRKLYDINCYLYNYIFHYFYYAKNWRII